MLIFNYMDYDGRQPKILVGFLIIFVFVIFGLVAGIVVIWLNRNNGAEVSDEPSEVEMIISKYQEIIDKSTDDGSKMNAYIDRAFDLKKYSLNSGEDLCDQISKDVDAAKNLDTNNYTAAIRKSILAFCKADKHTIKVHAELEADNE